MNLNLTLASLMNIDLHKFWRYTGSLTTPPCTEGIIWSVFKQPIVVNDNQLQGFRKNLFAKDYRNPQPLYKRIVYRSFWYEEKPLIPDEICCSK
jgi:carbonic anhydrase